MPIYGAKSFPARTNMVQRAMLVFLKKKGISFIGY